MHRRDFFAFGTSAIVAGGFAATAAHAATARSKAPTETLTVTDAKIFHKERRFVDLRFGRIAYTDRGTGEAALFVHGFPLNGFQWRGAIDRLHMHRRCIAPDLLGLGYTEPAAGQDVGPEAQVEMLVALLDHLKISTVDLIGNDSGGGVAQLFLVRHPARVRSLLLTNCDTEINSPPKALDIVFDLGKQGKFATDMLRPLLVDKNFARSDKGIGGPCFSLRVNPTDEAIDTYIEPLQRDARRCALSDAYGLALQKNPLAGAEAHLRRVTAPVRVVWGTADEIFPLSDGAYITSLFPNSRGLRKVEGGKLFFPEEFPDLIADELRRLWGIA